MPKIDFTDRGLRALVAGPTRVDYWDKSVPGPGLFGLRVTPNRVKAWNVVYRVGGVGALRRYTFGQFPSKGYAKARDEGRKALAIAQAGEDPAGKKREKRDSARETVAALFKRYEEHVEVRRKAGDFRSWDDVQRSLVRDVLPVWGTWPVKAIRRTDIKELVTRKALTGTVASNRLQAHISMLLSFGVDLEWIDANPAVGLKKREEHARDRHLSPAEIVTLWGFLDGEAPLTLTRGKIKPITMLEATAATLRDLFKVLLLCGQRLGETSNMKWADVDLEAGVWTIPAADAKNDTAQSVALSRQVHALLKVRRDASAPDAKYVFPCGGPRESSVKVWSQRTAAALSRAIRITFRANDLRRTMATGLGELGIEDSVISLCLNHKRQGVTGKHYDLSKREAAKREAWQTWADHVEAIVTERQVKVIQIRRQQTR